MAIRQIVGMKDEAFLRKKSRPVEAFDQKLKDLVTDLFHTLDNEDGYGLAAPQVGILKRVAVIEYEGKKYVLINPVITQSSGEQTDFEGCLSVRGRNRLVIRPNEITVSNRGMDGSSHEIKASGWLARIFCHEMDHLDGVLYIDKCLPIEAEAEFLSKQGD